MFCIITLSIGTVWSAVWPYLIAILLFGIMIGIHEFGHFAFAKLFKVRVNEFALGMGPKLFHFKKGETEYSLRLLPIGGFCAMEGEDETSEDEGALNNKPAWQRFIIVAAGAILNLLLGVLVVGITLACNPLVGTRTVHSFTDGAVSSKWLQSGDEILKINNTPVYSFQGISFNMIRDDDNKLDITVRRNGEKVLLKDVEFNQMEFEGKKYIEQDFIIIGEEPNILNVTRNAFLDSASTIQMVRLSLVDMLTGKYGLKDVSGPIGAISVIAETTSQGPTFADKMLNALSLLSMLTINIGVFNLLPIPALDGGRLFFLLVEMIRRKPIPPKKEGVVHTVGLVILLAFMAVVTVSDIINRIL